MENNSFCSYLWSHFCARPSFTVKPYCRYGEEDLSGVLWSQPLDEVINHDQFKALRDKALAGEKIPGCRKCYDEEARGVDSLRIKANREFPLDHKKLETINSGDNVRYLELFLDDV